MKSKTIKEVKHHLIGKSIYMIEKLQLIEGVCREVKDNLVLLEGINISTKDKVSKWVNVSLVKEFNNDDE